MSINKLQSHFQASLEDVEKHPPMDEAKFGDGSDTLEAEMVTVQETYEESDDADEVVDELDEVAEGMESIQEYLQASLKDGGLDPMSAGAVALATESYTRRLGLESSPVPSTEAFGGASDREQATTVSVEGIGDVLSKIWNAIKDALVKAYNATMEFFKKYFGAVEKLEKRIDKVEKYLKDIGDKKPEGKIKTDKSMTDDKYVKATKDAAETVCGDYMKYAESYIESLGKFMADSGVQKAESAEDIKSAYESKVEPDYKKAYDAIKKVDGQELAGGAKISVKEAEGEGHGYNVSYEGGGSGKKEETDPLDAGAIKKKLGEVKDCVKTVKDKEKAINSFMKTRKESQKYGDDLVKAAKGDKLGAGWTKAEAKKYIGMVKKDCVKPVKYVSKLVLKMSSECLYLAEHSAKAHKEQKSDS